MVTTCTEHTRMRKINFVKEIVLETQSKLIGFQSSKILVSVLANESNPASCLCVSKIYASNIIGSKNFTEVTKMRLKLTVKHSS